MTRHQCWLAAGPCRCWHQCIRMPAEPAAIVSAGAGICAGISASALVGWHQCFSASALASVHQYIAGRLASVLESVHQCWSAGISAS
eukprot:3049290-Pyramimonas_sp.AAC.1